MSYLVIVVIGILVSSWLLAVAGAWFKQDKGPDSGAWFPLVIGVAILATSCTYLYLWNFGIVGRDHWALYDKATYKVIQQTNVVIDKGKNDHYWVVVLQDAANGELYSIAITKKVPDETGFVRLIKVKEGEESVWALEAVEPFMVGKTPVKLPPSTPERFTPPTVEVPGVPESKIPEALKKPSDKTPSEPTKAKK